MQSCKSQTPNKIVRTPNKLLQTPNKLMHLVTPIVTSIGVYILEFWGGIPSMLFHLRMRMRQVYFPD